MEQRTDEWLAQRMGRITGTRFHALMSSATTRRTLMAKLLLEYATAAWKTIPQTPAMRRGIEQEPPGLASYALQTGGEVTPGGFVFSDRHPLLACSPDGLVGDDGGVELKRLDEENHLKILLGAPPDPQYRWQCLGCMLVTGRQWWDLAYFCESLRPEMRLRIVRYERDEGIMDAMTETALAFFDELDRNLAMFGLDLAAAAA
jgi:hypothetical protein